MLTPMVGAETEFDLYNIGSGIGHSVSEIFDSLRRVTRVDFDITELPIPPTFVDRVVLNTDRYRAEFGASRLTALDEGVRFTFEEIRGQTHD